MTTLKVLAQYEENYGDTQTPSWRPKGPSHFEIVGVDPDYFLYEKELCIKAIEQLLEEASNDRSRYTLIDWELQFCPTMTLTSPDKFESLVKGLGWQEEVEETSTGMFIDDDEWEKEMGR